MVRNIDRIVLFVSRMRPHTVFTTSDVLAEVHLTPSGSGELVRILRRLEKYGFVEFIGTIYGTRNATAWRSVGDNTPLKPLISRSANEDGPATSEPEQKKE